MTGSTVELTTTVVEDLCQVPRSEWDRVAEDSGLYLSHGWLRAVHQDPGVAAFYVLVRRDAELVGALPVFDVAAEGNAFYAPGRHHRALTGSGHWLLAGGRRGYHGGVLLTGDAESRRRVLGALLETAQRIAAERDARGLVWLFAPTSAAERLREAGASVAFDTVDANLDAASWDGYLAGLASRRRNATRRERRRFDQAGYHVGEQRLADCWKELAGLVANVQHKYGHGTTEEQMRRVLEGQLRFLDDQSVVFTVHRDGALVAGALEYRFGETLYGRMVGFDYGGLADAYEYFNLVYYLPVQYLERHGLRRVHLGIEAEDVKVERGARLSPLWTVALPLEGAELFAADATRADRRRWSDRYDASVLSPADWDVPW